MASPGKFPTAQNLQSDSSLTGLNHSHTSQLKRSSDQPEIKNNVADRELSPNSSPSSSSSSAVALAAQESTENIPKGVSSEELDSDDEYISSGDDEILETLENPENQYRHLTYGSGLAEHTAFFEKSLSDALDLVSLDSSLALQAQLSGQLNDKAKLLLEKQAQILTRLESLRALYKQYIGENKLGDLENAIEMLSARIVRLKNGHSKSALFRKKRSIGVVDQFPIEYNQARDKVLERSST